MYNIDQVYAALIYVWSEYDHLSITIKSAIAGFFIAFVVSILKTHDNGDTRWGESTLCGIFAGLTITGLTLMGIPLGFAGIIAGIIGYKGTKSTVRYLHNRILGEDTDGTDK